MVVQVDMMAFVFQIRGEYFDNSCSQSVFSSVALLSSVYLEPGEVPIGAGCGYPDLDASLIISGLPVACTVLGTTYHET